MKKLEKYSKFPLNIYYRFIAELGITCLTKNEKRIIFLYLLLLFKSFAISVYNVIKKIGHIKCDKIIEYIQKFYK